MPLKLLSVLCLIAIIHSGKAQEVVPLFNPSFEGKPAPSRVPPGWYFCGPKKESPPDLHPGGFFNVEALPKDGKTYIGLVARTNGTRESIGQLLGQPLQEGTCYEFSLFAARATDYISVDRVTREPVNYNRPAVIRVFGSDARCTGNFPLAVSDPVRFPEWMLVRFRIQVDFPLSHLSFQIDYLDNESGPYPANVLIDRLSPLFPVDCHTGQYLLQPDTLGPVPIQSRKAWLSYVEQHARQLRLEEDGNQLEELPYCWQDSQELLYGNPHLHGLGLSLKYYPEEVMEIAVKGSNAKIRKQRIQQLRSGWQSFGFSLQRLKLVSFKRNAGTESRVAENEFFEVRLR